MIVINVIWFAHKSLFLVDFSKFFANLQLLAHPHKPFYLECDFIYNSILKGL